MSILKYELMRTAFMSANPDATELEQITACINFARASNLYRVESELIRQQDLLLDEITERELAQIKK